MKDCEALLVPERPSGVWLYLLEGERAPAGELGPVLVAECGRPVCEAWWFVQDDDPLEEALSCRICALGGLDVVPRDPGRPLLVRSCTHCDDPADCPLSQPCRHRKELTVYV